MTAIALKAPVYTADKAWKSLKLGCRFTLSAEIRRGQKVPRHIFPKLHPVVRTIVVMAIASTAILVVLVTAMAGDPLQTRRIVAVVVGRP